MSAAALLDTGRFGVVVMDQPPGLFRYGLDHWYRTVRVVARGCELGWSDDEMWAALFDDDQRLATHRRIYGNRGPKKRPQPSLFDSPQRPTKSVDTKGRT